MTTGSEDDIRHDNKAEGAGDVRDEDSSPRKAADKFGSPGKGERGNLRIQSRPAPSAPQQSPLVPQDLCEEQRGQAGRR